MQSNFVRTAVVITEPQVVPGNEFGTLIPYFRILIPDKDDKLPHIKYKFSCAGSSLFLQQIMDVGLHRGDVIQIRGRVFFPWQAMVGTKHYRANFSVPFMFCYIEEFRFYDYRKEQRRQRVMGKCSLNSLPHRYTLSRIYKLQDQIKKEAGWKELHTEITYRKRLKNHEIHR